jgi:hypothetical protein
MGCSFIKADFDVVMDAAHRKTPALGVLSSYKLLVAELPSNFSRL